MQLLAFIRELFIAGTETTKTITTWEVLCFIHYPQTQEKLHAEIQGVIGKFITCTHRVKVGGYLLLVNKFIFLLKFQVQKLYF